MDGWDAALFTARARVVVLAGPEHGHHPAAEASITPGPPAVTTRPSSSRLRRPRLSRRYDTAQLLAPAATEAEQRAVGGPPPGGLARTLSCERGRNAAPLAGHPPGEPWSRGGPITLGVSSASEWYVGGPREAAREARSGACSDATPHIHSQCCAMIHVAPHPPLPSSLFAHLFLPLPRDS